MNPLTTWSSGAGTGLWLQKRARHVFREAARVPEFRAICHAPDLDPEAKLHRLGALMDASQASCRRGTLLRRQAVRGTVQWDTLTCRNCTRASCASLRPDG